MRRRCARTPRRGLVPMPRRRAPARPCARATRPAGARGSPTSRRTSPASPARRSARRSAASAARARGRAGRPRRAGRPDPSRWAACREREDSARRPRRFARVAASQDISVLHAVLKRLAMGPARCLLLALTAGILLPAAAMAQSVPDVPASPWVDPDARPPEASPPPAETPAPPAETPAPPAEAPPPAPPPEAPPAPVPATVPTTWGPTRPDANVVREATPAPPAARPRLSAAVGMGSSFDSVGFKDGVHPVTSFFTVLGIGDGLLGLDLSAFASSATREERMTDSPIDRLAVDLFGVV